MEMTTKLLALKSFCSFMVKTDSQQIKGKTHRALDSDNMGKKQTNKAEQSKENSWHGERGQSRMKGLFIGPRQRPEGTNRKKL